MTSLDGIAGNVEYQADVLWVTALITVVYQLMFFAIASLNKFDKVTDFAGGSNFAINAIVSLTLGGIYSSKRVVATVCVLLWAVRLAIFLLIRVLKAGDDKRFDEMREHFWRFLVFWVMQMLWVWIVGLSLTLLNAGPDSSSFGSGSDIAGLVLFVIGLFWEAVSDQQKFNHRFRVSPPSDQIRDSESLKQDAKPASRLLRSGLWRFSRQPNYFGEILLWWGIFILCLAPFSGNAVTWVSIISPIFITTLLLFLSGVPLAEANYQKRFLSSANKDPALRQEYLDYRESTSLLIPFPNSWFRSLPLWVKRCFFFEFSIYESKDLKLILEGASSEPDTSHNASS